MTHDNETKRIRRTIVIHAGRHKTGTTYLQTVFGMNRVKLLYQERVLYPETGKNPYYCYHHELIKALGTNEKNSREMVRDLAKEIENSESDIVLISSEYLSRSSVSIEFLNNISANLSDYNIELLFYLRKPSDFLCSRYAQQIKTGALCHPKTIWDIDAELDAMKFLDRYISVFGSNSVNVRSYDKALQQGGLLKDFLTWMQLVDTVDLDLPIENMNKRYSWLYLSLLRYANRNTVARKVATSRLVSKFFEVAYNLLPLYFDGKKPISNVEANKIDLDYAESIEIANQKYGIEKLPYRRDSSVLPEARN